MLIVLGKISKAVNFIFPDFSGFMFTIVVPGVDDQGPYTVTLSGLQLQFTRNFLKTLAFGSV